jgi:AraC-like DNA-binding protein
MPRTNPRRQTSTRTRQTAPPVPLPRGLLVALREAGVDVDALARTAGLAGGRHEPATPAIARAFLSRAIEEVPPWFGLALGFDLRPELWGVAGLVAMTAATLGDALTRIARYKRAITGDTLELDQRRRELVVRVLLADAAAPYARQQLDAELGFLVALARRLVEPGLRPIRVCVELSRPPYHDRYAPLFGCEAQFDCAASEVAFDRDDVARPLVSANHALGELLSSHAVELMPATDGVAFADRVRGAIRALLADGEPEIGAVARQLGSSARSLQRHLRAEGTSFASVLDEVRSSLARSYLRDPEISLAEISFLLGFSHPNSFFRAFRRWTGMTPDDYRCASI